MGLYQEDVHYYMTFFLAIVAGVDKEEARTIALAAQYIDVNEMTRPMIPTGPGTWGRLVGGVGSLFVNKPALLRYHFTQAGFDPARTTAESAYHLLIGGDLKSYIDRRVENPYNPQLERLMAASDKAPTRCSKLQFFGEYLHAFEDSFAHRDKDNEPYSATSFGLGFGHFVGNENPDWTYNHWSEFALGLGYWGNNFSRTMEMEKETFNKMKDFSNPANFKMSWADIESIMMKFTAFEAHDSSANFNDKLKILDNALARLGFDGIELFKGGGDRFDGIRAAKNRDEFLGLLNPEDYVGTILPRGTAPLPK
jgi:hypothetical protein